jgi:hypothetical protein
VGGKSSSCLSEAGQKSEGLIVLIRIHPLLNRLTEKALDFIIYPLYHH